MLTRHARPDKDRSRSGGRRAHTAPALAPSLLTPSVLGLAQAAYDNRQLPEGTLDPARLAVLAHALEAAGCTDAEVLGHLRSKGPHVRGCWPVDLLLNKE